MGCGCHDEKGAGLTEAQEAYDTARDALGAAVAALMFLNDVSPEREYSLAFTKAQEALFWASSRAPVANPVV